MNNKSDFQDATKDTHDLPHMEPRYSISHVKKLYKEIYDLDIHNVDYGYKGQRYRKYVEYNVYNSKGECIMHRMTLKALAEHLIRKGMY